MLISFMNVAIIVLLVNLNIRETLPIPILQGEYKEFSVEWYRLVGTNMCVQLSILILSTHLTNMIFAFLSSFKRCRDRGGFSGSHNTKCLSQADYEDMNTGDPLEMDYKYANLLVVLFLVMLYGSGIPILYVIGAVFFFCTYWVDKWLIFYHHRKIGQFDEKMTIKVISLFKYGAVLHFVGAMLMYSNARILPLPNQVTSYEISNEYTGFFTFGKIDSRQMVIYICFAVIVIACYILWVLMVRQIKMLIVSCSKKAAEQLIEEEVDFYERMSRITRSIYMRECVETIKNLDAQIEGKAKKFTLTEKDKETLIKYKAVVVARKEELRKVEKQMKKENKYHYPNGEVVGELNNYNMLLNEKYKQLSDIRKYLEKTQKKFKKVQAAKLAAEEKAKVEQPAVEENQKPAEEEQPAVDMNQKPAVEEQPPADIQAECEEQNAA